MPGTSNWLAAPKQSFGICASNLVLLPMHGFEANGEIASIHHELHIALTQAETNIQPKTLIDHVDGEPMTGIAALGNRRVLAAQLGSSDNAVEGAPWILSWSRELRTIWTIRR